MYHKIIIAGHLGRDPEMRYTPMGHPVTSFSVASTRRWTGQDGQPQEETIWFRISAFGKLAETCNQYLTKGRAVLIEGRLRPDESGNPRTWVGQDGAPRASFEVVAETVRFLGSNGSGYNEGVEEADESAGDEAADAEVADAETADPLVEMAQEYLGATVEEVPVAEPVFPANVNMKSGVRILAGTPISQVDPELVGQIARYWQSQGKYHDFTAAVLGQ
jgi:single-strand DNA-binding protein